nr:hypothetical protein [uncultured Methanospirillum sp.]
MKRYDLTAQQVATFALSRKISDTILLHLAIHPDTNKKTINRALDTVTKALNASDPDQKKRADGT